ncbi:MAG: hypothetical protein M1832_005664 [Thelocarpon impressellum]|nr:MAG: hypothetical protein M1832_005664 [Thelocarpon impressellum]
MAEPVRGQNAEQATSTSQPSATPWHAAYPAPQTQTPRSVERAAVLGWLREGQLPGKDLLLVDLRRVDHEGGTIQGSVNLPAQSFHSSMPTLYRLLDAAGVPKVVFYCGSSRGRGNRAAAWFADFIADRGHATMQSYVLVEGIKAWALAGPEYVRFMDDYREEAWKA